MSHRISLLGVLTGCIALALGGCSRGDPREVPIEAKSSVAFAKWRQQTGPAFSADEWRQFDAALNEIRLGIMIAEEASGSEAIQKALQQRIDGSTFDETLALGYAAQLRRLELVRREARQMLDGNALLAVRPGDDASARHLEELARRQQARLQALDAEMAAVEKKLGALRNFAPEQDGVITVPRGTSTAPLSRDEARKQFTRLVQQQRGEAMFRYGGWPARIDHSGSELTGEQREEFATRSTAAAKQGRVVIAVHLKGRWWIYDGPLEAPVFSPAVTARLSAADRAELQSTWSNLQAEIWARREAFNQGADSPPERRDGRWRGSAPSPVFPPPQP